METIELQLDEQTLERARRLAESRRCTLEELIREVIEQLGVTRAEGDPFLGMLADEPELMDQVTELAMRAREKHSLRQITGTNGTTDRSCRSNDFRHCLATWLDFDHGKFISLSTHPRLGL